MGRPELLVPSFLGQSFILSLPSSNLLLASSVSSYGYYSHGNSSTEPRPRKSSRREPAHNIAPTDALWPPDKRHLKVSFLDGNTWEQDTVKKIVKEHYNSIPMRIRFKFLDDGATDSSDIRITFVTESKAYIGRHAKGYRGKPTMWLNMHPNLQRPEHRKLKRQADILHEFGHTLGMEHEQKHPGCNLNLNFVAIATRMGWSIDKVKRAYKKMSSIRATMLPYDPKSIMHYSVDRGDTYSLQTIIPQNEVLSNGDKEFLKFIYPIEEEPKLKPKNTLEIVPFEKTVSKRDEKPKVKIEKERKKRLRKSWDNLEPTVVSGSGHSVVIGGYVLVNGSAKVEVQGGGFVRLNGSGRVSVNGDSIVELNGSGQIFVDGDANVKINGSGRVYVNGSGSAIVRGSGGVYFTG
ncbi:zincin [Melanomma pulvis-pyrius CBS 109.77]|uniref:Zincin n=1 Tax=Melanomma pulvis-pyrius CBS 109.77 TaxID=1314802 RepID=A0A6A6XRS2_9PLEO|nr:zincin [Melanomma pulvis-pyrius CBS 109.77]